MVLLVPIPVHYKDGGTVSYNAVLYSVTKVHSMTARNGADGKFEEGYEVGTRVRVLIFPVYDDVFFKSFLSPAHRGGLFRLSL